MIFNLCFADSSSLNVAEHFTQPIDYFSFDAPVKKITVSAFTRAHLADASALIMGGSGIFNDETWQKIHDIVNWAPSTMPIVMWGMGLNDHGRFDKHYNPLLHDIESHPNVTIGMRDCFYKNYVPCVSCMRPELDSKFEIEVPIGFYVHQIHEINLHYPTMSNKVTGRPLEHLWFVLKFLGSCETVVTNTYHGAYWATLLGRKVIVVSPFSNKFFGFKHEPVIIQDVRFLGRVTSVARRYEHALEECRRINRDFYARVRTFMQSFSGSIA
jgi:hypothetical protein